MQAFFQRYVDELDSLMQELEWERSAAAAQIRLGMFEGFDLSDFLYSLLFDFRLQHNNTTIRLESGTAMQLQQGLQNGQLPLSVVTSEKYFRTLGWKPKVQMLPSIDAVSMALLAGAGYAIPDDSTRIFNYQTMRHIMLGDRHTVCLVTTNGANAASQVLREYLLRRYAL